MMSRRDPDGERNEMLGSGSVGGRGQALMMVARERVARSRCPFCVDLAHCAEMLENDSQR